MGRRRFAIRSWLAGRIRTLPSPAIRRTEATLSAHVSCWPTRARSIDTDVWRATIPVPARPSVSRGSLDVHASTTRPAISLLLIGHATGQSRPSLVGRIGTRSPQLALGSIEVTSPSSLRTDVRPTPPAHLPEPLVKPPEGVVSLTVARTESVPPAAFETTVGREHKVRVRARADRRAIAMHQPDVQLRRPHRIRLREIERQWTPSRPSAGSNAGRPSTTASLSEWNDWTLRMLNEGTTHLGDLEVSRDSFRQIAADVCTALQKRGVNDEVLVRRYPGASALILVFAAVHAYVGGCFWEPFSALTGAARSEPRRRVWGQSFRTFAALHGLSIPPRATHQKYVDAFLVQAGLPTSCLGDLFELVARSRTVPALLGMQPERLIDAWFRRPSYCSILDQPVQRFLRERPTEGVRWVSGISEVHRILVESGGLQELPEALPERTRDALDEWLARRDDEASQQARPPRLCLTDGALPVIALAEQPLSATAGTKHVHISIKLLPSGHITTETLRAFRWGTETRTADTDIVLGPATTYDLTLSAGEERLRSWRVAGLRDPGFLPFRESDGMALPATRTTLPPDAVTFLLRPGIHIDDDSSNGAQLLVESEQLYGAWAGYTIETWSLESASHIDFVDGDRRWRSQVGRTAPPEPTLQGGMRLRHREVGPSLFSEPPEMLLLRRGWDWNGAVVELWNRSGERWAKAGTHAVAATTPLDDVEVAIADVFSTPLEGRLRIRVAPAPPIEVDVVPELSWVLTAETTRYAVHAREDVEVVEGTQEHLGEAKYKAHWGHHHVEFTLRAPRWALLDLGAGVAEQPRWFSSGPVEKSLHELLALRAAVLHVDLADAAHRSDSVGATIEAGDGSSCFAVETRQNGKRCEIRLDRQIDTLLTLSRFGASVVLTLEAQGEQISFPVLAVPARLECRRCTFAAEGVAAARPHVAKHLGELAKANAVEVDQYDDYKRLTRKDLPEAIYKCPQCDFYVSTAQSINPTGRIYEHLKRECPRPERSRLTGEIIAAFSVVKDMERIRSHVLPDLPPVFSCRWCGHHVEGRRAALLPHIESEHVPECMVELFGGKVDDYE